MWVGCENFVGSKIKFGIFSRLEHLKLFYCKLTCLRLIMALKTFYTSTPMSS